MTLNAEEKRGIRTEIVFLLLEQQYPVREIARDAEVLVSYIENGPAPPALVAPDAKWTKEQIETFGHFGIKATTLNVLKEQPKPSAGAFKWCFPDKKPYYRATEGGAPTGPSESVIEGDPSELLKYCGDDAVKWARQFNATAVKLGYSCMDEGWLAGWFANAIEHSGDVRRRAKEAAAKVAKPERFVFGEGPIV